MNYFIDCGTHFGQGIEQITSLYQMDSDWKIYTFEANPNTYKIFIESNLESLKQSFPLLEAFNTAIFNKDGKIYVNIEVPPGEGDTGQGSSIIDSNIWDPWNGTLTFKKSECEVECIDFSKWLKSLNITNDDRVIIKLDIEGSEYDVLEKMIQDDSIVLVTDLLVEFHHHFFTNSDEMKIREDNIVNQLQQKNVNLIRWH